MTLFAQQQSHPFSVQDLVRMDQISNPRLSPNGKQIVFVIRSTDLEANRGRKNIWLTDIDGKNLRQLTADPANDTDPVWHTDGKSIWFISSRTGTAQIWRIHLDSGDYQQITDFPLDVSNLMLSPDGKYLAFTMKVFPNLTIEETKSKLDEYSQRPYSGVIYDQLLIRHWDEWKDGRRSHLFVHPVAGGKTVDVMKNMNADTPSQPFGDTQEICFTPDARGIIFTAKDEGKTEAWSTNFDLFFVPFDASQPPRCLTGDNQAWDSHPSFSPDGKFLAYLAMEKPQHERDQFKLVLQSWPDGPKQFMAKQWDRTIDSYIWGEDGKYIYALVPDLGQGALFSIEVSSGKVSLVMGDGNIKSPSLSGKMIIFGLDNLKSPVELFKMNTKGEKLQQITAMNRNRLAAVEMGDFEQFTFSGWNDETVYGYLVKPVDFDPQKKYPVAFLIHGGPHGSFGNRFHYRWNPQTYSGAGFAAVMIDFHGSKGYGQKFLDSIQEDWGGKTLIDLQKGLAAALDRYPFLDRDRVGALGASYGGYMINWIAGNWPDGFRCLVNHDGNLDERMAYYNTEELWFPEWEHGGTPWDNPEGYEKQNPVNFSQNWKTPMLVIHSQLDYRVVVTQAIGTFNLLQRKGIPSKFLYFPDENHWVLKPQNSIFWHDTVIGWLDQWLKK
ncbi:MAG: S9 family peptidase [bacterium]|nr:MAG: S9 family peptidase [bacterium]